MIQALQKQIKQRRHNNVAIDRNEESDDDCRTRDACTVNPATISQAIINDTNFSDILNVDTANTITWKDMREGSAEL